MTSDGPLPDGRLIRCLIADDQAMVREGFAAMLAAEPGIMIAGQAADGADAVRQTRRLDPDVVLMDVRMPVMDGLQAAREILTAAAGRARPRVLMLTTFDLDEYVYEALRAGASGFVLKDATTAELIHAVKVVAAGDALLAPSVTRRLITDFTPQAARRPARPGHARRADQPRNRSAHSDRPGHVQHADQRRSLHRRGDHQDPRQAHTVQTGPA